MLTCEKCGGILEWDGKVGKDIFNPYTYTCTSCGNAVRTSSLEPPDRIDIDTATGMATIHAHHWKKLCDIDPEQAIDWSKLPGVSDGKVIFYSTDDDNGC